VLSTQVIDDPAALAPHLEAWDALAVAHGRPFCAPAWMLAWFREGATGDARLRVVLVLDEAGELVAVAPFFAQVGRFGLAEYRLLAAGFSHRLGVLARPGSEQAAARPLARALAALDPPPAAVVFEGVDRDDRWPELLRAAWPGRIKPQARRDVAMEAPWIEVGGDFDAWFARRGKGYRKQTRRAERRLAEEQVQARVTREPAAVETLLRLHHQRWDEQGGSAVAGEAGRIIAAATAALPDDRIGVVLLEAPSGAIGAELALRAGDTMAFWSGGFDPAWARVWPGNKAMLVALERGTADGVLHADLGGGDSEYKQRLADGDRPLLWCTLYPRGRQWLPIRLWRAPKHLRFAAREAVRRMTPERQEQIRRLIRRAR
jgi:CelD/BcsL family acetyltransferase involved in cellulose biosynthesis